MGGDILRIGAAEAASALSWWLDAGVDLAVQEQPRDWLAPPKPPAAKAVAVASSPPKPPAEPLPETLDLFRDWLARQPAPAGASAPALPHGAENPEVMLIAEMPGREDALEGRPIGGETWQLVERMLAAIRLTPDQAYSASLSCFHAPGARIARDQLANCAAVARRHIALVGPKRLLLLGDAPALALLGKPLAAARGHVHKVEGVRTIVTFHPRLLIKQPSNKRLAWEDLLLLMEDEA